MWSGDRQSARANLDCESHREMISFTATCCVPLTVARLSASTGTPGRSGPELQPGSDASKTKSQCAQVALAFDNVVRAASPAGFIRSEPECAALLEGGELGIGLDEVEQHGEPFLVDADRNDDSSAPDLHRRMVVGECDQDGLCGFVPDFDYHGCRPQRSCEVRFRRIGNPGGP